ncbi:MFS transporter [Solicola gregarius]|uniref:MFS transporter n=1 Tax=Solicola gregarius TaxID=2908642 RepID=A0AA46TE60_9ACTN|nr:MFS transporter [Solicola gregarius]UYM03470.1 MFS transporter [Solicola gregarius]
MLDSLANYRRTLLVACGGSFLAFLDVTITNLALPDIGRDFDGVAIADLSWVVTLYTVVFAALLAPAGRIADAIGRRRLLAAGMLVFTVASLAAAAAPTYELLLAARAIQGLGAALLLPASLAYVLSDSPPERRPAAIGLWSASAAVAAALGPVVGGILVDVGGWRWLFCINVPIGAWLVYETLRLPRVAGSGAGWPDWAGTTLLGGGVLAVVLGTTQGEAWGWSDPRTLSAVGVGVIACVAAVLRSKAHPRPAVATHLWRSRTYVAANVVSLAFGASLFAWLLVGVLFVTTVWGYTELEAGLAMSPGGVVAAFVGIGVSRAGRRVSPRLLVTAGSVALTLVGVAAGVWLPEEPAFLAYWLPVGLVSGAAVGAVSVGVSSAAALAVAPGDFASATGLNVAIRQIGGAIGVAVLAAVLSSGASPLDLDAYRTVYWLCAAATVVSALAGTLLRLSTMPPATSSGDEAAVARG